MADKKRPASRRRRKAKNSRQSDKGAWAITYKWVAMGTLVAYSAIGSRTIKLASAQEWHASESSHAAGSATPATSHYEIAPGPLDDALGDFSRISGLQVQVGTDKIRNIASPGVRGNFTATRALEQLLAGTGLKYDFVASGAVKISVAPVAQSINVTATPDGIGLSKYTQPLVDTPQTINTVSQHLMQEQGSTTLRDALRNVAGISLAAGEGSSQGDNLTIRGFTARNDIFLDGMRDFGSYYRDPFNDEGISVLQGPSSVMFGRGSTGGVVSQTSKSPRTDGFIGGALLLGTDSTKRVALDIDQPLHALGENTAFRLNLMGNDSGVADRNIAKSRRYGIAPSLAFGIGTPTRLTLNYFREWEDDIPDYGIPWFFDHPAPVNRKNYYGFTHGNYLKTGDDVGTVKFEHDFSHAVSLRSQLRYANYPRAAVITEPQINAPNTPATPLDQVVVTRNQLAVKSVESYLDEQTDLAANFHTGSIRHTLVSGVEFGRETSDPTRFAFSGVTTANLLDPDPTQAPPGAFTTSSRVTATANSQSAYVLDTAKLSRNIDLTGGLRWDRFSTDYAQFVAPALAFHRVDEMPSWRGALVYKPRQSGSVYFDFGTSFNPSAEGLALSAANANTPPEKNRTFEVGTKWDLGASRLTAGGSVFRTDKTNAREPDPDNPLLNVLGGSQRVWGIEGNLSGHVTSRWELLASYAYLHGAVVNSQFYPLSVGYPLANVPRNTFNLWSTYRLPWRHLELGGGSNFVDSRTASSTVPLNPTTGLLKYVPGYWIFSAMASYPLSDRLDLQVNAYNLANKYYYDEPHPGHIVPGAGRSLLVSLNFKFARGGK